MTLNLTKKNQMSQSVDLLSIIFLMSSLTSISSRVDMIDLMQNMLQMSYVSEMIISLSIELEKIVIWLDV
jgi:hypothetical protein